MASPSLLRPSFRVAVLSSVGLFALMASAPQVHASSAIPAEWVAQFEQMAQDNPNALVSLQQQAIAAMPEAEAEITRSIILAQVKAAVLRNPAAAGGIVESFSVARPDLANEIQAVAQNILQTETAQGDGDPNEGKAQILSDEDIAGQTVYGAGPAGKDSYVAGAGAGYSDAAAANSATVGFLQAPQVAAPVSSGFVAPVASESYVLGAVPASAPAPLPPVIAAPAPIPASAPVAAPAPVVQPAPVKPVITSQNGGLAGNVPATGGQSVIPQYARPGGGVFTGASNGTIISAGNSYTFGWGAALLGLAVIGGGVALAAGGGGGSSSSPPVPPAPPTAASFRTAEFLFNYGLDLINADEAYARGGTGQGVVVGVVDGGIDVDHPEYTTLVAGDALAQGGRNFLSGNGRSINPGTNVQDYADDPVVNDGHGTHVAGIIAALRNGLNGHGVAPLAKILPLRAVTNTEGSNTAAANAIIYATQLNIVNQNPVRILNLSFGPDYSGTPLATAVPITTGVNSDDTLAQAMIAAANAGIIMVSAAGNERVITPGLGDAPTGPGIFPYISPANENSGIYDDGAATLDYSALLGLSITVVDVDSTGALEANSNQCGVAAAYCMAAPGTNIPSSTSFNGNNAQTSIKTGTSQAAPHVAGAAAILLQMFPTLTTRQVVSLIFSTANKTGIYANQTLYGQGLLDLERATRPVGPTSILTGSSILGPSSISTDSGLNLGSAFGDGLTASLQGRDIVVVDDYQRNFSVNLDSFVQAAKTNYNLDLALDNLDSMMGASVRKIGDTTLSFGFKQQDSKETSVTGLSLTSDLGNGNTLSADYDRNPALRFGAYGAGWVAPTASVTVNAFTNPYLSLAAKDGFGTAYRTALGGHEVTIGSFIGKGEDGGQSFGTIAQVGFAPSDATSIKMQFGNLTEKNHILGSEAQGAFALANNATTLFTGVDARHRLDSKTSLIGSLSMGMSFAKTSDTSLVRNISTVTSSAFAMGVERKDVLRDNDSLLFSVSQPLRVESGTASLSISGERDIAGNVARQDVESSLAPTARSIDLGANYSTNLSDNIHLSAGAIWRRDAGHSVSGGDEGILLTRVKRSF